MIATRPPGYEEVHDVLAAADEPLTAREVLERLRERDVDAFETAHRVATVLGRVAAHDDSIVVVEGSPYRYRLET
ncbi:hypothetical protein [Halobellus sp. GM3]|uniref:hypothetical protein n=1 Tax=Halobellus sp. GM3 TaxID=3458410 RepID=UPI00403D5847